jgi:hypothetical protein
MNVSYHPSLFTNGIFRPFSTSRCRASPIWDFCAEVLFGGGGRGALSDVRAGMSCVSLSLEESLFTFELKNLKQ